MCSDVDPSSELRPRVPSSRARGFTLVETVVAMGICSIALSVFYTAVSSGMQIVKNAREQSVASQILEQRFDAFRARPLWTNVITPAGVKDALAQAASGAPVLGQMSETYDVAPYPGGAVAFAVTRRSDGSISATGNAVSLSQTSVRITGSVNWGAAGQSPRRRAIATILTKGGL